MPRSDRRHHEHAARGQVSRLPRRIAGAARFVLFRLRFRRVVCSRFSIGRGAVFDIGPCARVRVGPGTALGRDFSGSFQGDVVIGRGVWFGRGATVSAHRQVHIGDGCVFAEFVSVHDNLHRSDPAGTAIDARGYDAAPVVLGDRVLIGAKATILPGVTIGSDAIVAAGAVVTRDVEAGAVVAGVPARRVE